MIRRPSRPVRVLSSALAVGALLTTAACSDDGGDVSQAGAVARQTPSASPTTTLTQAGADAALITAADIEDDWTQVKDADVADWHDSLRIGDVDVDDFLSGRTDSADCQRLLDGLYTDQLLGKPSGASALRGFQQGESRLLYQVAAYERTDPQEALAWLETLPEECDEFTVTGNGGGQRTVQVIETTLPDEGDDRVGLRVSMTGTSNGQSATLTEDVAAVRVGTDAITVTAGGLDGGQPDSVEQAVKLGTQRLKDVLAGKTPAPTPSEFD
ncbi:hypothetical protein DMH25_12600 [Streptomyces sp. WAC 01325]|uniref:hypothetical protein n=1 Tax=Streptomyces TaxID=1883 RepID=UPI000F86B68B|nr:hypothetical protein [Streptomyces sp. WAC 01325]RSN11019.1 hypothetical protein DMH25_12600 [Streptomyces sp. WAC 01325]WCH96850.1 hypothetical protein POD33_33855 [Streptomyces moderatus]